MFLMIDLKLDLA